MVSSKDGLSALAEPLCWGSPGLPLLPAEWRRFTRQGKRLGTKQRRNKKYQRIREPKGPILSEYEFFTPDEWWEVPLEESPTDLAVELAESIRERIGPGKFPEQPILTSRWFADESIQSIPFLKTTVELLEQRFEGISRETVLMEMSTLEVWERFNDTQATLDLIMTTRSWSELLEMTIRIPGPTGESIPLVVHSLDYTTTIWRPAEPETWEDLLTVLRRRLCEQSRVNDDHPERDFGFLSARLGLDDMTLTPKTLEAVGSKYDVTRERVRQVCKDASSGPMPERSWPIPQILRNTLTSISSVASDERENRLTEVAQDLGLTSGEVIKSLSRLYSWFGVDVESLYGDVFEGLTTESIKKREKAEQLLLNTVKQLNGRIHVVSKSELANQLREDGEVESFADAITMIERYATNPNLPDDMVFMEAGKDTIWMTTIQCLQVNRPLRIADVHQALARRGKARSDGAIPTREVLSAVLGSMEDLVVSNGSVDTLSSLPTWQNESVISKLVDFVRNCGGSVTHQLSLTNYALEMGIKPSTIAQYIQFHPMLVKLPKGLVTVVGCHPTDEQRRIAQLAGSSLRTETKCSVEYLEDSWQITIKPNLRFLTAPQLTIPKPIAEFLETQSVPLFVNRHQHGTLRSWSHLMQFSPSALQHAEVTTETEIVISIDRSECRAVLTVEHR